MTKERKQANLTKKLSYFFYLMLITNLVLKVLGMSSLSATESSLATHIIADNVIYFGVPLLLLTLGIWFSNLSKSKAAEATSVEVSGCYW